MKKILILHLVIMLNYSIYSEIIISDIGFHDSEIGTIITKSVDQIPQNWISYDKKYFAYRTQDKIYIFDKNNILIYQSYWNEQINNFSKSDTIYILGWASDRNVLWFWSVTPTTCAFFAEVDLDLKIAKYYSTNTDINSFLSDYYFDTDRGIIFYSNYFYTHDETNEEYHKGMTITLKSFDIKNQNTKIVDEKLETPFSPEKYRENTIKYLDKDNMVKQYQY